jgi:predicted Zn-dependent peptidase
VGRVDRLPHLLPAGLDPAAAAEVAPETRAALEAGDTRISGLVDSARGGADTPNRGEPSRVGVPCTIEAMFERTALPAGPRVISARLPGARSVSIAAYVLAGSRLETPGQTGVAHFMEHITFKGTAGFPSSRAISEAIEGVGGSFNAATDRESTVYWVRVPRREAARAMNVLGELIIRPILDDREIDQERGIIIEEVRSYLDDPAEFCQILFQRAMFGSGPLGREICGDEADIRALPEATIRDFWRTTYRPANTVIALAGDIDHSVAVELAHGAFGSGNGAIPGWAPAPTLPAGERVLTGRRATSQAQLSLGVPALRRDHPQAWTLAVLNAVLGDGMSSRLFLSVREEHGLAYDISSGLVEYADAGVLEISAGVDPLQLPGALKAILVELAGLRDAPVSDEELAKAKAYLAGGLELRFDETRHVAAWIGGQEALHDRVLTLDEALAAVAAVDAGAIQALAVELFRDEALRLAVVAPTRHLRGLDRLLHLPGAAA